MSRHLISYLGGRYLIFNSLVLALIVHSTWSWIYGAGLFSWCVLAFLVAVGVSDLTQKHHAILRNYPVIGHLRFLLEFIRPEIRQYFIESDNESEPFSRSERSLVYSRSKGQSDKRPFGTQINVREPGYEWLNHSINPSEIENSDFRTLVGGPQCLHPYSLSLFNVSAMSFGALSANAILALNRGASLGGFAHDTGEGSISKHHRVHQGDLIWEIGSGYFGCRHEDGSFSEEKFKENALDAQVKMIEVKLSQGAKPGHGGVLLGPKVTAEIAQARGVPQGVDCISPARHSEFDSPLGLLQFIQRLRQLSGGKPVGFKLCIGHTWEWFGIAKAMQHSGIHPDFIVIDGSEGGTGAAPLEFTDHIGTPMEVGLRLVHNTLVGLNLRSTIRLGASGKIISAFDMFRTLALGADWCNSARGFMFALGCIQAHTCHSGMCPTGVTTQDPLRQRALVVSDKAVRVKNFHHQTLAAFKQMLEATGVHSPQEIGLQHLLRRISANQNLALSELYPSLAPGVLLQPSPSQLAGIDGPFQTYWHGAQMDRWGYSD